MDASIGNDIATIMADPFMTVAVSIGNSSTRGIPDLYDQQASSFLPFDVAQKIKIVTIKTGSLAGLVDEASIVVDGVAGKVRQHLTADDGAVTHIAVVTP